MVGGWLVGIGIYCTSIITTRSFALRKEKRKEKEKKKKEKRNLHTIGYVELVQSDTFAKFTQPGN